MFSVFLFLEFHERGSTCAREAREVFFFLKVEARVCGGVDTPKLKKKWAPKKVREWEWGPKTGPFSHCNLCCVAAFAVAGGPYSLTGGGFGGPIETSGVKY